MSDLTLNLPGGDLATPMEGANPSVLPWTVATYHLRYGSGDAFSAAHVTQIKDLYVNGVGEWLAYCAGPYDTRMEAGFDTAEAARAAVEEHIAAHIDTNLTEGA